MSSFEKLVENWPLGSAIVSERAESFDRMHGLFFAPIRYNPHPIFRHNIVPPTNAWIREQFLRLVRDEFQDSLGESSSPSILNFSQIEQCDEGLIKIGQKLRDNAEQGLIYNSRFLEIFSHHQPREFENRLRSILINEEIGNKKNKEFLDKKDMQFLFSRMKTGVRICFPGLPFRDQNPFRTDGPPDHVTLAEVYYLIRLHCTALAIYQVLPTGADVLVLSDGSFFGDVLGVSEDMTSKYLKNIRKIRDELNLSGTIQILDLRKLIDIWDDGSGIFAKSVSEVQYHILSLQRNDGDFRTAFNSLMLGVRRNFNSRSFRVDPTDLASWIVGSPSVNGLGSLPESEEIEVRSAKYAALNLCLKWHEIFSSVLPTAVRATVHPKAGQIGLPKLGSCLPWNGVAIVDGEEIAWNNVEVHSLTEATRRGFTLTPIADGENVIYYQRNRN